jgi:hypothetical protein
LALRKYNGVASSINLQLFIFGYWVKLVLHGKGKAERRPDEELVKQSRPKSEKAYANDGKRRNLMLMMLAT